MSHLPLETFSAPSWPGLNPQRFPLGRKHLQPQDAITKDFSGGPLDFLGRKHYEEKYDVPHIPKPSLKIFAHHNKESTLTRGINTKKHYNRSLIANPKKSRCELKHFPRNIGLSDVEYEFRGIKVFECNNKPSDMHWSVEESMQEKKRLFGFSLKRNQLPLASLGDKCYKHPDYSKGFFQGPGLIPGSNFFVYKKKTAKQIKKPNELTIVHYKEQPMTWKEKKNLEEKREDEEAVQGLDKWEEQVLTEANPNWKDPEKVGPPDLFAEREKLANAGGKKVEPKKK